MARRLHHRHRQHLKADDGAGVRVAELLGERDLGPDVEVVVGHLGGMQLACYFTEADRVIVADAIDAGDEPGSVFRFRAEEGLPMLRSHTSHGISVPELITAARLCGSKAEVLVYAIQIANVDPMREGLSPEVEEACVYRGRADRAGAERLGVVHEHRRCVRRSQRSGAPTGR